MLISKRSPLTNKINELEVPVTEEQLYHWKSGMLIQKAMPNLDKGLREFLISGITPDEWIEYFGTGVFDE